MVPSFIGALFGAVTFFAIFCVVLVIALYVISSYFLYKLYKLENTGNEWMAWVPFIREYNLFSVMEPKVSFFGLFELNSTTAAIIYILWPIVTSFIELGQLTLIFDILYLVFAYVVYSSVLKKYKSKNEILYGVLSVLIEALGVYLIYKEVEHLKENNVCDEPMDQPTYTKTDASEETEKETTEKAEEVDSVEDK